MEYGSEYHSLANKDFFTYTDSGFVQPDWQLYRSGRDALRAFARIAGRKTVLIPALSCESMALPFEQNGYEVLYYKMRGDLSADEADVLKKLGPGSVLLYMRYFGIPAFSDAFLQSLRDRGEDILLIEDRTHDILRQREETFKPDAVIASLRKWTALPEGGMLCTGLGRTETIEDGRFADIRSLAMGKKSLYLKNGMKQLKTDYMQELAAAAELLDADTAPVKMSRYGEEYLRHIDFEAIMRRRVDNFLHLERLLEPLKIQGRFEFMSPCTADSTLYFCILLDERDRLHKALIDKAVYAAVIWPLPEKAEETCPISRSVSRRMLAIPCDHRCRREDMDFIAGVIKDYFEEET